MGAVEFVKKHGLSLTKAMISGAEGSFDYLDYVNLNYSNDAAGGHISISDLKRLVESHALVGIHDYQKSKEIVENAPSDDCFYSWTLGDSGIRDKTVNIGELRKAIAEVEACQ